MADLTANAPLRYMGDLKTEKYILDSSAAQHPYKGSPMIIDQSEDTLCPRAFVDATVVAAADIFVGVAIQEVAVAAGATENQEIECAVGPSIVGFKSTVFTNANLGSPVYMSDSATLSATVADNPYLGKLVAVRDGYCYVELSAPQVCTGA